jgi:DNA-binding transcriptional MerR regulator
MATPGASQLDLGSDKLYFKIGEVAEILGVPAHVLRYWETEFRTLRPQKSSGQQRVYRRSDVAMLLRIKHLLYEEKFTIAGARRKLARRASEVPMAAPSGAYLLQRSLAGVQDALAGLKAFVEMDPSLVVADPASRRPPA